MRSPDTTPTRRDPWAWIACLAAFPMLARCAGAPPGEPVAEDFDMLHRMLLERSRDLLDGGGSDAVWRPLANQVYYALFGRTLLDHPAALAALQAAAFVGITILLYRVLRPRFPGPIAAAAASFPALAESARVLVTWSSPNGDLGSMFFSALALHEASRRRLGTSLIALAAALLSKEVAVVTALLLPFLPGLGEGRRGGRVPWLVGCGAVLVAWAATYSWVRQHAGLELPHGVERETVPLLERLVWAWSKSLRALHSLAAKPGPWDLAVVAFVAILVGISAFGARASAAARERLAIARPWILWGLAWFVLAAATIAPIHPLWSSVRSLYPGLGWGIAVTASLGAASPVLVAAYFVLRLVLLLGSPGASTWIAPEPVDRGEFTDFPRITRVQRLMRESRAALQARFPTLPHGAAVGFRNLPLSTEYAFGGPRAVRNWYADSTLHFIPAPALDPDSTRGPLAYLDYQEARAPQVVLLDPEALRWQMIGVARFKAGEWAAAIDAFDRSDSAQVDKRALVFLGDTAGRRADALAQLRRFPEAEIEARRALAASSRDTGARLVLAITLAVRGQNAPALAHLDTLLAQDPKNEEARALANELRKR